MLANISVSGDPVYLEHQKITTINITQGRSGRKINHRNATTCRKSHKTGPRKLSQGIRSPTSTKEFSEISKVKAERRDYFPSLLGTHLFYMALPTGQGHLDKEMKETHFSKGK